MNAIPCTPKLPTNIVDFRGLDSSIILILRGVILMPIEDSPESLSQAMLVGIMLVGKPGASPHAPSVLAHTDGTCSLRQEARVRRNKLQNNNQDSSQGGAVETGCGDLYDVIY